jgi:hypothetical protein
MRSAPIRRRLTVSASALAIAAVLPTLAPAAVFVWNGGTDLYNNPGAWSLPGIPGSGDDAQVYTANSVVEIIGTNQSVGTLELGVAAGSGNQFTISNGSLGVYGNAITNNGVISLANSGSLVSGSGVVTVGGTGSIILDDTVGVARIYGGGFVFSSGQTVRGSGQLGINQTIFSNSGLVSADVSGRGIDIDAAGGNGGVGGGGFGTGGNAAFYNTGTLQATNGGTLALEGGLYENGAGGVIQALAGSTVVLNGDSRILNGTLKSVGTGVIDAHGTTQYLTSVTLASGSNLDVNNDNLYLNTTFANNGTVKLSNNASLINETGALTITGTGTIQLDNSGGVARIYGGAITFGSGQSVVGSGQLGINTTVITNNNLFSVNSGSGLDIDVAGGNGGVGVNNGVGTNLNSGLLNIGTIEATGTSTLSFEGGLYENAAGGVIRALNGSTINLNGDSRILNGTLTSDATSVINAHGTTQYLTNVTLSSGSNLDVNSDSLYVNTTIANNSTIRLSNNGSLVNETGALAINGTGTIVLDNSAGLARIYNGNITFGAGQTVSGSGQLGINATIFTNNGLISAGPGTGIDIDVAGGNGGLGVGNGVGTNGNAGLFNTGTIQADNSTLVLEGGLYENANTGTFGALNGGTFVMNGDASLYNLKAGGVLDQGTYSSTSTGAATTLDLRGNAADSIVTIGGTSGATTVILSGANSALNVLAFSGGAPTSIDSSLTTVSSNGNLYLLNNRSMTIVAGGGAFSNAGMVALGGGTFGAVSFNNSGIVDGNGVVAVNIVNTGSVNATSGTLATRTISGPTGAISSGTGSTLDLTAASANSTAGQLTNDGHLVLGSHNLTITSDYANANFGSGNAFDRRANVTGSGDIYGVSYTVDLSGPALSGGVIDVGNVRTGGSSSTTLTITNNGTATNIVGAVQNTGAPSIAISNPDFAAAHGGGSATTTLSYTGTVAGSLAGQTITVVNNFANIGPQTLAVQGNVYQIAIAGSQPSSVTLGASRVGGAAQSSVLTISNVAPDTSGYTEALTATATTNSPFQVNGGASATVSNIAAGGSAPVTVSLGTASSGAFSNTVTIGNTSIPVAGSGFSDLTLASQSVTVSGNVYAPAVANLSSTNVAFGPVRQGASNPTQSLTLTNGSVGALSDQLVTSVGALPTGVAASTPGPLDQGQQGNVVFSLNIATAGQISSSGSLNFTSHDSQLSDLALASQTVDFTGTVTQLAQALVTQNSGVGVLSGGGSLYTLDLGSFASGSGAESSTLGVTNNIPNSAYAELLNGLFTSSPAQGFSFAGQTFTGLSGGSNAGGNLLSFDTTGRSAGTYTDVLTFNGYSSYPGESNFSFGPITVDVSVRVTGGVMGVPEPAAWAMMLVGFGLIGGAMRRRTAVAARRAAA